MRAPADAVPVFQVDAFADRAFTGNPAAVVVLDAPRSEAWMQAVAGEMNLSETAFVYRDGRRWDLRWFTPTVEVPLCGHATLATAHALVESERACYGDVLLFRTRSGELRAWNDGGLTWIDLPSRPASPIAVPAPLVDALGVDVRAAHAVGAVVLAELDDATTVRRLRPDIVALLSEGFGEVVVTAVQADGTSDFVSRFFAPGVGIPEDPVTGAAHCILGPFWAARTGRNELVGVQCSARGGLVRLRVRDDRVHLGGGAVTVLSGALTPAAST
ncbi:MAG: PhzF family phenazine biosynthesis protein [Actinobacteria bacterium]|nr:PhzF family phenazine biosynthesis protein [Actinomycetota bacterium]